MEFTKDIYFDNEPEVGKETKITYSGYLFQNGSTDVNIVYGFGENWNNTTTKQMEKQDNGFVANIRMRNFDTLNFCFSDSNNNWDNNYGFNFISPILPEQPEVETQEDVQTETQNEVQETENTDIDFGRDYSASIDDIIEDILGNTTKNDLATDKDNNSIDKILESINEEALPEIEALFNDLFFENYKEDENTSPVQEVSMDPSLAEELREVAEAFDNMISTPNTNKVNNSVLAEQLGEAFDNFENMVLANPASEPVKNTDANENAELIKLFNELFETSNTPITFEVADEAPVENTVKEVEEPKLNVAAFNLDGLVSDLLEPVITSETNAQKTTDETSLFEDIKAHEDDDETSLAIINSGEFSVSSRKLGYFYKLRKRIRLALLKLAKSSKELVKQLGL